MVKCKKAKIYSFIPSTIIPITSSSSSKFDSCFLENHLRAESHLGNGNYLFESVSPYVDDWRGKPFVLRLKTIL
jgi:hypothetical protein